MTQPKKIAIVGAGISGLTLAYRLHQKGHDVHLFEKSNRTGGNIQTIQKDGFLFEKGPDGFLQQKPCVRELAIELGIENELITTQSANRRSMILQNDKLIEVPDGFYLMSPAKIIPFLKSPLLSWKGKARTLLETFVPPKKDDQEESLANFVRRRFGKENLEKISQAMLGGIYTADPEHLSMQAALPRFVEMEKKYGSIFRGILKSMASQKGVSGARYGLFGSFHNGMSRLTNALTAKIPVDRLHLNASVQNIRYLSTEKQWEMDVDQQKHHFDTVFLAVPSHIVASLMADFTKEQRHAFQSIPYAGSVILHFGFKNEQIRKKPSAVGFIVPQNQNKHFIACSFISNKYVNRAPKGHDLIRVFAGGALQEQILELPAEQIRNTILKEISEILDIQGQPTIEDMMIWPKSMPQYTMGHLDRVKNIQKIVSEYPNLHIIGNAYAGVGIPDLIETANFESKKIFNT